MSQLPSPLPRRARLEHWWWKLRIQLGWIWCDTCREPRLPGQVASGGRMLTRRVWVCGKCRYA